MGLGRLPYISEKVGRVAIYVSLPDNVDKLTAWLGKVVVDPLLNTVQNDTTAIPYSLHVGMILVASEWMA